MEDFVPTASPEQVQLRAEEIFHERQQKIYRRTDRLLAYIMLFQWCLSIMVAQWISPKNWIGSTSNIHIHVWSAIFLGGAITILPVVLALFRPGDVLTRNCIATAQLLMSALLIHLCGGRIETHFHVFCSLAFLALYRDWRIFIAPTIVVALDHGLRGLFWPQSVYGVSISEPLRFLEHVGWVLFEDAVLIISTIQSSREMAIDASHQAQVELTKGIVENAVIDRTNDLKIARDQALEASQLKTRFLANISHEIRTPMSGIIGVTELLMNTELDAKQSALLKMSHQSAKELMSIINDLLDLSKIEARKMTLENVTISPISVTSEVISLLQCRAQEKELILELKVDSCIPDQVKGDAVRLRQVLINLIANAIKFTHEGKITVSISVANQKTTGNIDLRFDIIDTGIGISENQHNMLFEPFVQADGSTTRKFGGSGLGLSICKRIVELMGGTIGLTSVVGSGSCFWFVIPYTIVEEPTPRLNTESVFSVGTTWNNKQGLPVLIVEDNPVLSKLAAAQLTKYGLSNEVVSNGEEALVLLSEKKFGLILMDCQMPVLDGYETTTAIRRREAETGERIPVVAMTASALPADRERCLLAGMDDYVSKPVQAELLEEILKRWLGEP